MTTDLFLLAASVGLFFLMVMTAAALVARGWTPEGVAIMFGNREKMPPPSPAAGRADRAAKNMQENLVMFAPLLLAAHVGGGDLDRIALGAWIFLVARVLHWPTYIAGIPYLRTTLWVISVVGMGVIASAMWTSR